MRFRKAPYKRRDFMSIDVSEMSAQIYSNKFKGAKSMSRPEVIGYCIEHSDVKKNEEKEILLKLFLGVQELSLKAMVSEYNEEGCMSQVGANAIIELVDMYDIDGVVVVTAKDISSEPEDVIRFVNYLSEQGVEVASIYNDLPNPDDYNSKETMRTKYCTVTIFEDV